MLYETCPAKYHYWKYRPKASQMLASHKFSVALHEAVRAHHAMEDACDRFTSFWGKFQEKPLMYTKGRDHFWYKMIGMKLISLYEAAPQAAMIAILSESQLHVPCDGFQLVTRPDLIASDGGVEAYVEYKTSDSHVGETWVRLSDQLTAGALAMAHHLKVAAPVRTYICNFVLEGHNGGPEVVWHRSERSQFDMQAYLAKVKSIIGQIERGEFYRRGLYSWHSPCSWCDCKEMCLAGLDGKEGK